MRIGFFGDSLTSGVPGSSYYAILRERLPDDQLLNFGKVNDTVVSLYRRISAMQVEETFDLAFLWIGVNDVPQTDRRLYRAFHTIIEQRRARDMDEFYACFQGVLNLLIDRAERVIVVPPVLRGENLHNRGNGCLAALAGLIRDAAVKYERTEFLDLRTIFIQRLAGSPPSDYVPENPLGVLLDALTLRSEEQIDSKAAERGLHLTLDGVHLNSAGATLVAEEFKAAIQGLRSPMQQD